MAEPITSSALATEIRWVAGEARDLMEAAADDARRERFLARKRALLAHIESSDALNAKSPDRGGNLDQGGDNHLAAGVDGDVTASIPREGMGHHDGRAPDDDPRID